MYIQAVSRNVVQGIIPQDLAIVISIRDSDREPAILQKNWKASLFLQFDDIDPNPNIADKINIHGLKLFSEEQADSILDFINLQKPSVIIVNCEAGISRSAAVALFLEEVYNHKDERKKYPFANRHVYRTLMNVHQKRLTKGDSNAK